MESTRNKLIKLLADSGECYISGQLLSEKLSISRAAIWKHMKELEKDGYQIEGKSKKGYRILKFPNKLSENTIQWGLNTEWLGKTIVHKQVTTSTQHIAHQLARDNADHGTIVVADEQTAGKGRMDHTWNSPKNKGIWMSLILRPATLPYLAPQFTLLTATVLADVLTEETHTAPKIKWPNDILLNGKKIAGILTEMQAEQDTIQYVVIGIGINVNQSEQELPADIRHKATSLAIETGRTWDTQKLIQRILLTFEQAYDHYLKNGFLEVKHKWESYGFKIGETIRIKTMRETWRARFMGIAEDGALLTKASDGEMKKIYSAEIDWFKQGGENNADTN
ncbi:biotin--[acetyl-CoA-carboxylase] ligase [Virgibacillus dakarensis]|uniref:Bifunctional ligase/repressor BirA n=1 Tax=Lentibacillus populi TaxID=1827502 RepID=A0A9W5X478_9BACI|nr:MULTISPECIES: biotin--[acetyl-CoA-carboxylase] ligase [Bacillaceae]MBT2214244.1 biotin--[acetyl-CoA-carboxylase] ligase [Virgibacillus dakarensis]MTW85931.1 biotin--[acetyl-CoA-carboxylase] ligase [Virgibacillus dakarensis]GGB33319.1 bifunctional ligase/repressor BirA [Lentibacillus populi]